MSICADITGHIKLKQFERSLTLFKTHQNDVDGRTAFKFLRCMATQLKLGSCHKENSVEEFLATCCATLSSSQELTADDTEFTQGVLALYHLVTPYVSSGERSETCLTLAKTFLSCLQKLSRNLKDVESIAASFFAQIWNLANKVNTFESSMFRKLALTILVHGGSIYRGRLIDKLGVAVQESSDASVELAETVFDELILYHNSHSIQGSQDVLNLLSIWVHIVFLSSHQPGKCDENSRTSKLIVLAKSIEDSKIVGWLVNLVLGLFGNSVSEVLFSPKNLNNYLAREFVGPVFVRIVLLCLNSANSTSSQSDETKEIWKTQMSSTLSLLLYFNENIDHFEPFLTAQMQMDVGMVQIKCLTRACSTAIQLFKNDPSKLGMFEPLFSSIDKILNNSTKIQIKMIATLRYNAEITASNASVIFHQKLDYANAAVYSRKSLEYLIKYQFLENSNEQRLSSFAERFGMLYDSRKATRDWDGIIDDFKFCLIICYSQEGIISKNCQIHEHIFLAWSRFKRDLNHGTVAAEKRFLEMTTVDLLKQNNISLDRNAMWEQLFQEFQALNRRKGSIPKVAFSVIAQQAFKLAKTPFQKGVSSFLLSREGNDFKLRHKEARNAIEKLEALPSGDNQHQGHIFLALAYVEVYVSQQEILRKQTEEEMESLGPLIQSSTTIEIPPGEDASSVTTDGTSVDALSYSYLKMELELKNQEWMGKSLVQWEELALSGWFPKFYNNIVFNCIKSLGYFFRLYGNSFFSARVWSLMLEWATQAKCDDEIVLAASELLKLGWTLKPEVLKHCHEVVEKEAVIVQDQVLFFISLAWSKYFDEKFTEAWEILSEKVMRSSVLISETPSKSALLLMADANLLRSLLAILPEDLSKIPSSADTGPIQIATKAVQTGYSALKCYVLYAQQQQGWDFYGQEWNVLRNFLETAVILARLYLYTAAPREARFYLKEALNAAQKHVSVLRTAEALLELCNVDLMLDNTIDCQSKLILICHLMDTAPLIVPDTGMVDNRKANATPGSPVIIRSDRRRGISTRKVPEALIQVQQDATHRYLELPFNHQGTSPATKTREISGGIFSEHTTECTCFTCTSELVTAIRCGALLVQAKLWSCMGFQEQATEDFIKGQQLVQTICIRLKSPEKNSMPTKSLSKRLFDVPEGLDMKKTWNEHKVRWFQPPIITGMELLLEHLMHRIVTHEISVPVKEPLDPLKTVLYQSYIGPLDHRVMKLTSGIALMSVAETPALRTPEPSSRSLANEDKVKEMNGLAPKTPALGLRKPIEIPAPRRARRNLLATKVDDTITIDDDEDGSDCDFSRRRLGQPKKALLYSSDSDSDSDVIPPTPPPPTLPPVIVKTKGRTRVNKNMDFASTAAQPVQQPVERKYPRRGCNKLEFNDDVDEQTGVVFDKPVAKTVRLKKATKELGIVSNPNSKTENKCSKSKSLPKSEVDESDLSNRLAATKINTEVKGSKETQPKRTTRSTRK